MPSNSGVVCCPEELPHNSRRVSSRLATSAQMCYSRSRAWSAVCLSNNPRTLQRREGACTPPSVKQGCQSNLHRVRQYAQLGAAPHHWRSERSMRCRQQAPQVQPAFPCHLPVMGLASGVTNPASQSRPRRPVAHTAWGALGSHTTVSIRRLPAPCGAPAAALVGRAAAHQFFSFGGSFGRNSQLRVWSSAIGAGPAPAPTPPPPPTAAAAAASGPASTSLPGTLPCPSRRCIASSCFAPG